MTRRLYLLFVAVLACGLIAAGCGGDDNDGGGGGSDNSAQEENQSGGGGSSDPRVQQNVESCKQSVDNAAQLSDDVKKDLKEICEKAANGDADDVRRATQDVCAKIVEETVPAGPARDQAVKACKQGGQSQ